MKKLFLLTFLFIQGLTGISLAQPSLSFTTFSTGYSRAVDIRHCNDSRLFVVQQAGKIIICDSTGTKMATPFLDLTGICTNPVSAGDERGLLGMAFHPDYKNNGYFYVNYTASSGGATTIARYSVNPNDSNLADNSSALILLTIPQPFTNHNGGSLSFGPDGYLYIGMGDGGSGNDPGNRAQDRTQLLGKMLRIDVDHPQAPLNYSIPPTNPYIGTNYREEIWSYGLRNPWKWNFDRVYGDLWIGDVGQNLWEEIDFEPLGATPGRDYGWRCYEGNVVNNSVSQSGCPDFSSTIAPVAVYSHSTGCSVTGGFIYRGAINGSLYGYYVYSDYCDNRIRLLKNNYDGTFSNYDLGAIAGSGSFSTFGEDYRGELYLSDTYSGKIYSIKTNDCLPTAAIISLSDTINICSGDTFPILSAIYHPENTYQWYLNGNPIQGATGVNYATAAEGSYMVDVINPNACSNASNEVYVKVNSLPIVDLGTDLTICHLDPPLLLNGNPPGGVFSGPGIIGDYFDLQLAGGPGSYEIYYSYTDSNGCSASDAQIIDVVVCSGLEWHNLAQSLHIYPNPNNGSFNLEFNLSQNDNVDVIITDIAGKLVYSKNIAAKAGYNQISIDVEQFQKGFYLLKLGNQKGVINKSFVIK